jgi:glutathione S-transferase
MIDVYQAEWCPFSSAVRERLNELELPFVCRPVPAERDERAEVMRLTGGDPSIPVVVLDDGTLLDGDTDEILAELDRRFPEPPGARRPDQDLG